MPNVQEFMQRLDAEKKQRDAEIDNQLKSNKRNPDVKLHKNELLEKRGQRKVRDPVTGKDVEIRDADMDFEEAVENPQVRIAKLASTFSLRVIVIVIDMLSRCLFPTETWANMPQ